VGQSGQERRKGRRGEGRKVGRAIPDKQPYKILKKLTNEMYGYIINIEV